MLLTKLASQEESHVVLIKLMNWRSAGLDPLYAEVVEMKQRYSATRKLKLINP